MTPPGRFAEGLWLTDQAFADQERRITSRNPSASEAKRFAMEKRYCGYFDIALTRLLRDIRRAFPANLSL
ncbi:MAG: hypothetical protein ABR589_13255 [Chthoniobacterales bacterium]